MKIGAGRWRAGLLGLILVLAFGLIVVATPSVARQGQPIPSAQGHAQVIAQGVSSLPAGEAAWRVVYQTIEPDRAPTALAADLQFMLVDQGALLLEDAAGEPEKLLGQGEATFAGPAPERYGVAIDDRPAGFYAIDVIAPAEADEAGAGFPVYAGVPFASPPGERDFKLIRDVLVPGERATIAATEPGAPILVLATLGMITVDAADGGDPVELRVGQAAEFSGEVTVRGEGLAPATFVAAVIGRAVPEAAAGSPVASPAAGLGTVAVRLHACPAGMRPGESNTNLCPPDFNAVALNLIHVLDGGQERNLGAPTADEFDLRWTNLPAGDYLLRATGFGPGLDRFFIAGLAGAAGDAARGYPVGPDGGYQVPIIAGETSFQLDVYAFASRDELPPGTPVARTTTEAVRQDTGAIAVRVFACPTVGLFSFDPLACALATPPFDVSLASVGLPAPLTLANTSPGAEGFQRWTDLEPGTYILQVPRLPAATVAYFVIESPAVALLADGTGYAVTVGEAGDIAIDLYTVGPEPLPPTAVATVVPTPTPATLDSDGDGLTDDAELNIHGTDPTLWDADGDGISDGAEIQAGTDPLTPNTATASVDSDSDGLPDADEAALGTDPTNPDTDGDGWLDGNEILLGSDPLDPASFPRSP
ncbi:MAG: thrombospondin type 3 repeat-containing protein [Chloroflexota bacterium]|nr:thrombospondin type 3 repeat-containing protein [Chloroflexota bacterium]